MVILEAQGRDWQAPTPGPNRGVRISVLGASLRRESLNVRLAALAARALRDRGAVAELASMREFDVPLYDHGLLEAEGVPQGAQKFGRLLTETDGFVMASPEYNYSIPGVLKNLIDWTSRIKPWPFTGRHGLLMSASPMLVGGNRGLWALRVPLESLGAHLYPDMFSLANADSAFTADGDIARPDLRERFDSCIEGFLDAAEAARHYPAAKKLLGERSRHR
jgi:chromate reductase, NAD(P)H dehydrogenase (quinone)